MPNTEKVSPYALTSLQRVKDVLFGANSAQTTQYDLVLTRYVNAASAFLEGQCARQFVQRQYINETITAAERRQKRLVLRQFPVTYVFLSGDILQGTNTILNCSNVNGIKVGMPIFAPNLIPQSNAIDGFTTVTIVSGTTITISKNATGTQVGAQIEVSGLINMQYLSGLPVTNPVWTSYLPDNFQLKDQGRAGVVRLFGSFPTTYDSSVRATFWAGYLVDWENAGDGLKHTLPADLSSTADNMVVRRYKRMSFGDKSSESMAGATVSWDKDFSAEDKATILRYRRMPIIM